MSSGSLSNTLRQYRPLLLACEAIGWLHMAGKAKADFLRGHGGQPSNYEYKRWLNFEFPASQWESLIQWVQKQYPLGNNAWPASLTDFITKHTERTSGLLGLLQAGHGMASGIEKNLPSSTSAYLGQSATHMWLTSPFGHPVRNLLADPPQVLTDQGWQDLLCRIAKLLKDLQALGAASSSTPDDWWRWREEAVGPGGWLRQAFLSTLAETRLPNNDVTLWDQSYVAAALFKAAVAGAVLVGSGFNWRDNSVKQQTRWRVLTVGFGTRHYEARAVKIGDWTGARQDIERFFTKVRKLVEVDLAVGALIYRDDETLAFTFPGLRLDNNAQQSLDNNQAEHLRHEIEAEIDRLAQDHAFETPPCCVLSTSTRSFVPMVAELRRVRDTLAIPLHRRWSVPEAASPAANARSHVCPVCQVRLNQPHSGDPTDNARKSRVCAVCAGRRKGRLDAWLQGEEDTIWIDEIADDNNRVALLSFSLEVEPWIEGKHIDSLRTQSIREWWLSNPILRKATGDPIDPDHPWKSLFQYIVSKLESPFDKNDLVLQSLQEGYQYENCWKSFFEKIVEDRADSPACSSLSNNNCAQWIAHQLFCKLPSPGRIYRFWRSAEQFFDELLNRFRAIAAAHENRWRTKRLILYPDTTSQSQPWEDRETYSTRLRDAPLELLYLKDAQAFVTIANLARCLPASETKQAIQGKKLELKGEWDQRVMPLTVVECVEAKCVEAMEQLGDYAPVIPLDLSPQRFRVLVPLNRATECIEAAIAKWQEEYARVWDRMPLRIGMVAFPRMTPFQAVIESARNVETALSSAGSEWWRVIDAGSREGVTALSLERKDGHHELVLIPTRLPDGRLDVFYPYMHVQGSAPRDARDFQHPRGRLYRHAADLQSGDGVSVEPSYIATVFLDTTARRFDRPRCRYFTDFRRMRETWRLLCESAPSLTALQGVWDDLVTRQMNWRDASGQWSKEAAEAWVALAGAVFEAQLGLSGARLQSLVDAARSGIVEWAIEWHMIWLKEKTVGESS